MKKVLIINGPNINMLGIREPEIYGTQTFSELIEYISEEAAKNNMKPLFFQSNSEGEIITEIQNAYGKVDGIVINPGAYAHTSIAIADALKAVAIPTVEVHLTDTGKREPYRKHSYISEACIAVVMGKGIKGYAKALSILE